MNNTDIIVYRCSEAKGDLFGGLFGDFFGESLFFLTFTSFVLVGLFCFLCADIQFSNCLRNVSLRSLEISESNTSLLLILCEFIHFSNSLREMSIVISSLNRGIFFEISLLLCFLLSSLVSSDNNSFRHPFIEFL